MDPASVEAELASLRVNVEQLWQLVRDHEQRFDTLQTRWWKRLWFRVLGWPGQVNLNAERPSWRPWQKDRWPRRGRASPQRWTRPGQNDLNAERRAWRPRH